MAATGSWIAFGSGSRTFSVNVPLLSGEGIGRIVFGVGALIMWLIVIGVAVQTWRKLRGER
jgi:hypothetical protein